MKQPEALMLAEHLEDPHVVSFFDERVKAAAELRRLHAEVDRLSYRLAYPGNFVCEKCNELLEALKFVMSAHGEQLDLAFEQANAVIAKTEKEIK